MTCSVVASRLDGDGFEAGRGRQWRRRPLDVVDGSRLDRIGAVGLGDWIGVLGFEAGPWTGAGSVATCSKGPARWWGGIGDGLGWTVAVGGLGDVDGWTARAGPARWRRIGGLGVYSC